MGYLVLQKERPTTHVRGKGRETLVVCGNEDYCQTIPVCETNTIYVEVK